MSRNRAEYLKRLLDLYCGLPHTAARRPSLNDRRLAALLFDRGISLDIIETAFLLALARRSYRDPQAQSLPLIRSLAYFLPLIDEILLLPPNPDYLAYLRARVDQNVQIHTGLADR
ncbi:MAG TPA: hypothetical protein VKM72_26410 [Thermoanaerobaculia bacterium]|nr:hypothetical protein [Thermoanaerobaculia bacterium]